MPCSLAALALARRCPRPAAAGVAAAAIALVLAACGTAPAGRAASHTAGSHAGSGGRRHGAPPTAAGATGTRTRTGSTTTTAVPAPTTTTGIPAPTTTTAVPAPGAAHGPLTSPPLPAPGPGFVEGRVTAVGDSVMVDYATALAQDIPGIDVQAAVSRQWTTGETLLGQLKADGTLGAVVIVALGTNSPLTTAQFDAMASLLAGASRVVFVNVHVDRTWQDANNAVLASGVARTPRAVLVDWNALATANPGWLYPTGTHLPIDGPGAQALARLVAQAA